MVQWTQEVAAQAAAFLLHAQLFSPFTFAMGRNLP